jgi:M-phase inducer tyrosine phosphatase
MFLDRLIESRQPRKKQKTDCTSNLTSEMTFFAPSSSSRFLQPPPAPSRRKPQLMLRDEVDEFLSSDLEASFASTVSLYSPSHDPITLTPDLGEPMDISPAPAPNPIISKLPKETSSGNIILKQHARPRAFTSAARLFGNDISNGLMPSPSLVQESKPADSVQSKKTQRSALPTEWLKLTHVPPLSAVSFCTALKREAGWLTRHRSFISHFIPIPSLLATARTFIPFR